MSLFGLDRCPKKFYSKKKDFLNLIFAGRTSHLPRGKWAKFQRCEINAERREKLGKKCFLKAPRPFMDEEEREWVSDVLARCYYYCCLISYFFSVGIVVLVIRFLLFFGVFLFSKTPMVEVILSWYRDIPVISHLYKYFEADSWYETYSAMFFFDVFVIFYFVLPIF